MTAVQSPATAGTISRPAPARRIGGRRALANALTLAWRNVAQLRHSPEKLIDVTLMPIIFLLLFLYVFGGAVAGSTHAYLELLLPRLVAQMAMFATMNLGTALSEDIHKGVFDRFRSLPIARSSPLTGAVLGDTVRFIVVMAVLTGFGSALGFRFHTSPLAVLAAFGLAYGPRPGQRYGGPARSARCSRILRRRSRRSARRYVRPAPGRPGPRPPRRRPRGPGRAG